MDVTTLKPLDIVRYSGVSTGDQSYALYMGPGKDEKHVRLLHQGMYITNYVSEFIIEKVPVESLPDEGGSHGEFKKLATFLQGFVPRKADGWIVF